MAHPNNAAYVSADGLVSFDRYGRKLDSLGNVSWNDYQSAGDAGAEPIYRPEPQQPAPAAAQTPGNGWQSYVPPEGSYTPPQRSTWDNSVMPSAAAPQRRPQPGVLAPGGVDPATGRPVPTAYNGMLEQPQMQPQQPLARNGWRDFNPTWENMTGPLQRQMQSYVPPPAPQNAFQQASTYWPGGGLPMPSNQQFDPMPVLPPEQPAYRRPAYQPPGLPMPNNLRFDPYR